jgi:hypothetical protein
MADRLSLLAYARSLGVPMGSILESRHAGWTTDEKVARKLAERGAHIEPGYNKTGPRGWEVSFRREDDRE